jgi:hypothetical protein
MNWRSSSLGNPDVTLLNENRDWQKAYEDGLAVLYM